MGAFEALTYSRDAVFNPREQSVVTNRGFQPARTRGNLVKPGDPPTMTPAVTLQCDQAIFTSIRGPMGEGYRIIAASRGLRPEEKQAITRLSPSHEALCWKPAGGGDDATRYAAAFYTLPTSRLCVAFSRYAGAEHTARGGHRVYTHNVVFDEQDFPQCGFNPFHVVRAMATAGLTVPRLTHGAVLPEVSLPINTNVAPRKAPFTASFDSPHRRYILQRLLDEQALIVPVQDGWLESTEALLMGVPGPMRAKISFGAGLRFSLGRRHRLHLLCDKNGAARSRIAGQPVEYLDRTVIPQDGMTSAWIAFVDRHWIRADCAGLAHRTSRPFTDLTHAGRERIGSLYNTIDAIPLTASLDLLSLAAEHIRVSSAGVEDEIRMELVVETQRILQERLTNIRWHDAQPLWPRLVVYWRQTDTVFAQPLIEAVVRSLLKEDPLTAAEAALEVAAHLPSAIDRDRNERLIDEVLNRVVSHMPMDAEPDRLARLCTRWQSIRPAHPALRKLVERCSPAPTASPASR